MSLNTVPRHRLASLSAVVLSEASLPEFVLFKNGHQRLLSIDYGRAGALTKVAGAHLAGNCLERSYKVTRVVEVGFLSGILGVCGE
jgi:hypothetical protein